MIAKNNMMFKLIVDLFLKAQSFIIISIQAPVKQWY